MLMHLGNVYECLGEYEKAKNLLEQSYKIYNEKLHKNHFRTVWNSLLLGKLQANLGNYARAKIIFEK